MFVHNVCVCMSVWEWESVKLTSDVNLIVPVKQKTEGKLFTEYSFNPPNNTIPCARQGKRSAGRILPGWWWWTARTCCQTRSLWTVGSATQTCSQERGSCWGSVSTASAGKIQEMGFKNEIESEAESLRVNKGGAMRRRWVLEKKRSSLLLTGLGRSVLYSPDWISLMFIIIQTCQYLRVCVYACTGTAYVQSSCWARSRRCPVPTEMTHIPAPAPCRRGRSELWVTPTNTVFVLMHQAKI